MKQYIYISDGMDNGKTFSNLQEAVEHLYRSAAHAKIHLGAKLVKTELTETKFSLFLEKSHFLCGKIVEEIGIRYATNSDYNLIRTYFEINRI